MSDNQSAKVGITSENASEMVEMLREGKPVGEICDLYKIVPEKFDKFLSDAVLGSVKDRTPELQILRDGILDLLLGESIIGKAFRVLSKPHITIKETELLALSAQEKKALKRKGYEDFIASAESAEVLLKVERTTAPPPVALLEKLLKFVAGDISIDEFGQQLAEFTPIDPRLDSV